MVKDANNNSGSLPVTLTVNLLPLKITNGSGQTPVMPVGTVGTAYTSPVIAASGGSQMGYTLTINGQLPPGITANPISGCSGPGCNLILSGTPTQQGTFSFTANATDSLNDTAQLNLQIIINPPGSAPHISSVSPLPGATIGQSYSFTFAATGGTGTLQWSLAAAGPDSALHLSSAGVFSGTPSQPNDCQGVYGSPASFQVKVTDANNLSDSKPFCLSEFYATPTVTGISPSSVTTDGQTHTVQVQGTGFQSSSQIQIGSAPVPTTFVSSSALTFTLQPGSNGSSKFFTIGGGEFDPGSYGVRVLTSFSNPSNSSTFTITQVQGPNIQSPIAGLPTLTVGNLVASGTSNDFQAQGGTPPYTWSASGLPPGVSMNASTGGLAGTPTQAGSFNATIMVKDASNNSGSLPVTLTVNLLPLKITNGSGQTPVMPVGTVGTAYTSPVIAAAGGSQMGYTLTINGQLPPGITANPISGCSGPGCNLILSGTPTQQGTFSFTANATDSLNDTAQLNLQIIINPSNAAPPQISSTSPLPGATIGQSYSFTFVATGGTGTLQWSLASGLPDSSLQLSGAGVLSGTPSQPNDCQGIYGSPASFQVKVTDANNLSDTRSFCLSEFYATPTVTGISPSSVATDGQTHTVQVQGTGFQSSSQIQIGSAIVPTTFVSSTTLTFTLQPGSNGTSNFFTINGAEYDPGSYSIRVLTSFSSPTNSASFTITN
jgi:hypothetical protein